MAVYIRTDAIKDNDLHKIKLNEDVFDTLELVETEKPTDENLINAWNRKNELKDWYFLKSTIDLSKYNKFTINGHECKSFIYYDPVLDGSVIAIGINKTLDEIPTYKYDQPPFSVKPSIVAVYTINGNEAQFKYKFSPLRGGIPYKLLKLFAPESATAKKLKDVKRTINNVAKNNIVTVDYATTQHQLVYRGSRVLICNKSINYTQNKSDDHKMFKDYFWIEKYVSTGNNELILNVSMKNYLEQAAPVNTVLIRYREVYNDKSVSGMLNRYVPITDFYDVGNIRCDVGYTIPKAENVKSISIFNAFIPVKNDIFRGCVILNNTTSMFATPDIFVNVHNKHRSIVNKNDMHFNLLFKVINYTDTYLQVKRNNMLVHPFKDKQQRYKRSNDSEHDFTIRNLKTTEDLIRIISDYRYFNVLFYTGKPAGPKKKNSDAKRHRSWSTVVLSSNGHVKAGCYPATTTSERNQSRPASDYTKLELEEAIRNKIRWMLGRTSDAAPDKIYSNELVTFNNDSYKYPYIYFAVFNKRQHSQNRNYTEHGIQSKTGRLYKLSIKCEFSELKNYVENPGGRTFDDYFGNQISVVYKGWIKHPLKKQ